MRNYIIIGRDKSNSKFEVMDDSYALFGIKTKSFIMEEKKIIQMIKRGHRFSTYFKKERQYNFFTVIWATLCGKYDETRDPLTQVIVFKNHIKTKANNIKGDNISSLPITV